ncbi:MAG: ASKHA domain-containing protein, partial [Verrucomicrobiota bacterium]
MIRLHINTHALDAEPGPSLFDYAEQVGVRVPTTCNKQGKCRECLMEVLEGMELLSPPTPPEAHLQDAFRLSCRCHVVGDTGTIRCQTMRRAAMRIEHRALELPTRKDPVLDPAVTRDGDRILLDGEEIAQSTGPLHGLAMDLGTTTVVLRLLDLETGDVVAHTSFENPQRFGGSDVMARIQYDTDHKGRVLQRTLLGYLTHAIEDFPVDPRTIYELVVAGNATMRDLFFGLNVYSIGQTPYQSITELELAEGKRDSTSLSIDARRLRLPIHPRARVYALPLISGHVGADTTACLLAIDIVREERLVALMDIGTNTELVIGNKDRLLAASCPAGPAFEGGAIACGMPGLDGAIESVVAETDDRFKLTVIGDKAPEGLCGSGLIDLLSELLRTDRMNELGRFEDDLDRVDLDREQEIYLLESDVNELAQAKGANVAGLHIVFDNYGIAPEAVDLFYLAGGFGRHLR